jgi:acetylornithine deacetylase/succinyl-diaminopimelate desuccinylase-like protein
MSVSDELVGLLKELVQRPSCWDNAEDQLRLGKWIEEWYEAHGVKAEVDELGNVIVNRGAPVVMNGHIDVVPPAGEADYQPKIRGDKMIGRGTSDMKGGIAVMMMVMKELHKQYTGLGAVFQVTEESEYEKTGADILCERGVFDQAKFILEAEPTGVDPSTGKSLVMIGSEGGIDWSTRLTTDDTAYHAANLHLANNAILGATRYIQDLLSNRTLTVPLNEFKRSYKPGRVPNGKGPINVAKIAGGVQPTWTPNHCELEFEKRLFPTENWKSFHERLKKHSRKLERITRAKLEVEALWHADPYLLDPKSDGYKFWAKWARTKNLKISFMSGPSDLNKIYNYLKSKKGCEVAGVNFGPGTFGVAHRSDEFIQIGDLERIYRLYLETIRETFEGDGKLLLRDQ